MPSFSVNICFPIVAIYNLDPDGGAKIKGIADVEVVHNEMQKDDSKYKNCVEVINT